MRPPGNDKLLDDVSETKALHVPAHRRVTVAAVSSYFLGAAGEEHQVQILAGEFSTIGEELPLSLDPRCGRRWHEIVKQLGIGEPDVDRLHPAHGEPTERTILRIGAGGIVRLHVGDQLINQDPGEIPVIVVVSGEHHDEGSDHSLGDEIVELDVGVQVVVVPTALASSHAVHQIHHRILLAL